MPNMKRLSMSQLLLCLVLVILAYVKSQESLQCDNLKEEANRKYYNDSVCCLTTSNDMNWIQHGGKMPGKCAFLTQFYANKNRSECLNHCAGYGRKTRRKRGTELDCVVDPIVCNASYKYRSADGSCNNLDNPRWGMSNRGQQRLVPNAYQNGKSFPRMTGCRNQSLPNPRLVSNMVHNAGQGLETERYITLFMMQWGQFLAHDLVLTPLETSNYDEVLECCGVDSGDPRCLPLTMPENDGQFKSGECMDFQRSEARISCNGERNPNNKQTSFIDASLVYGSSIEEQYQLRSLEKGKLIMNNNKLMVDFDDKSCDLDRPMDDKEYYCAAAGDERVNEWPGLAALHTVFSREHNRLAEELYSLNPKWDDEKLYQEARKIVGAQIQYITYKEFLPMFIRGKKMKAHKLNVMRSGMRDTYDPNVNPTVLNSFSTAILRMGHSFVHDNVGRMSEEADVLAEDNLDNHFFDPELYHMNGSKGLEYLLFWACSKLSPKSDRKMQDSIRNRLFKDEMGHRFDLATLNIHRGRDHGLPGYNEYREYCGLSRASHFGTNSTGLVDHDPDVAEMLAQVYSCPDDIDLFTGSMTERKLPGVVSGPLQECIMIEQFKRLKHGDRFFFERGGKYTGIGRKKLAEIKKMKLSSIMCANTGAKSVQRKIFSIPMRNNPYTSCGQMAKMDLKMWSEK